MKIMGLDPFGPGIKGAFFRFLLSGGFVTVVTYAFYLLLNLFLSYRISYTIAFISGIGLAYILSQTFVFQKRGNTKTLLLFPFVYLAQYIVGLGAISLWVEVFGLTEEFAPLAAILLTVPLTFILSRWVFSRN